MYVCMAPHASGLNQKVVLSVLNVKPKWWVRSAKVYKVGDRGAK